MDAMQSDDSELERPAADLIGADEVAFTLPLTEHELKLTYTALHSLLDDLGHEEQQLIDIVRGVLAKLPDEHSIRAINIS